MYAMTRAPAARLWATKTVKPRRGWNWQTHVAFGRASASTTDAWAARAVLRSAGTQRSTMPRPMDTEKAACTLRLIGTTVDGTSRSAAPATRATSIFFFLFFF